MVLLMFALNELWTQFIFITGNVLDSWSVGMYWNTDYSSFHRSGRKFCLVPVLLYDVGVVAVLGFGLFLKPQELMISS